ncbi:MAG: hypothetical protein ACJ741_04630 [Pyrinomonadaceae bacterium]
MSSAKQGRKATAALKSGYVVLPLSAVREDPNNEFIHPEPQIESLMLGLTTYGQQRAVIIDQEEVVIAGEGVLTAMRRLGWETGRFKYSALTGAMRAAYRQLDNMSQRLARLNETILAANLAGIAEAQGPAFDFKALGFDDESFARALDPGAWTGRVLDLSLIGDYDPNAETFVIKVAEVEPADVDLLLMRLGEALEGTGYAAARA